MLISPKLPIGVATIYKPFSILILLSLFIFLTSCAPVNFQSDKNLETTPIKTSKQVSKPAAPSSESDNSKLSETNNNKKKFDNSKIQKNISIIMSKEHKPDVSEQFINVLELAIYKKNLINVSFDIHQYSDSEELKKIINDSNNLGKIYLGPLNSKDTNLVKNFCDQGAVFFSFSSQKGLAGDCVYLINFFPENEIRTVFNYLPKDSKVAILYPENKYGYYINGLLDKIVLDSNSVIINRASYKDDISNVRSAIKELGKYELRKYELNRQKKILATKKDEKSKKRLKRLEKFKTTKDFDFTHIIIADYGLRLLQVAPLLPYYDIDPDIVKFVGTGVWDDPAFFDEPSLQNSIFPGVEKLKRQDLIEEYQSIYEEKILRVSTLPYDLLGILSYVYEQKITLYDLYDLLNNSGIKFDGVDGNFYFMNNIIERDLDILKILDGKAEKIG